MTALEIREIKSARKNKASQQVQNQIFHKININYQNIFDLHEHTTYIQYMKSKSMDYHCGTRNKSNLFRIRRDGDY
jgi:histidinol dehydrogenase